MRQTEREKRLIALALVPLAILTLFSHIANAQPRSIVAQNVQIEKVHMARV